MNHPDSESRTATHIGPRTLPELCLDLRMSANGSADPISEQEMDEALAYLRYRVQHWAPSGRTEERFDEAVRALVLATIAEVEERRLLAPVIQSPITDTAIDAAVAGAQTGLHVFTADEEEYVIATTPEDAAAVYHETVGDDLVFDDGPATWTQLPDDRIFGIRLEEDDEYATKRTCAEWAQTLGRTYLGSADA